MQTFTPDPTKLFRSRLWCWGTLVVATIAFAVCNVVPLGELELFWYLTGLLAVIAPINVYLAESDYARHAFALADDSAAHGNSVVSFRDLDEFVWQIAPFPQTDNGGCRFVSGETTIEIRFNYLSDDDAINCLKTLRQSVPVHLQKNWPQFCHTTALRLHNEMHHPDRELPPPAVDEQQPLKQSSNRRGRVLLAFIIGGFIASLGLGTFLERLGLPNATLWCLGVFIVVKMALQASMVSNRPVIERNYDAAQQIWQTEVMGESTPETSAPVA
jgi:hypothetical protein